MLHYFPWVMLTLGIVMVCQFCFLKVLVISSSFSCWLGFAIIPVWWFYAASKYLYFFSGESVDKGMNFIDWGSIHSPSSRIYCWVKNHEFSVCRNAIYSCFFVLFVFFVLLTFSWKLVEPNNSHLNVSVWSN